MQVGWGLYLFEAELQSQKAPDPVILGRGLSSLTLSLPVSPSARESGRLIPLRLLLPSGIPGIRGRWRCIPRSCRSWRAAVPARRVSGRPSGSGGLAC